MQSKTAFLFPGQGSQSVGMLDALASEYVEVKDTFTESSDALGADLWKLVHEGPGEELNRTENTQPALVAASVAVWRVWQRLSDSKPDFMAGHSLGEYSALVCAGTLSLTDAVSLVAERGRLMQAAVPDGVGAMAAVLGGDRQTIAEVCKTVAGSQVVAPANFNSSGQTVIAGHAEAVDRALEKLREADVKKTVKLAVSVPSHTPLMREAADELAARMQTIHWQYPAIPVVHNATAAIADNIDAVREALTQQLYQPVRWDESVQVLVEKSVSTMFECGPGKVLTGLCRRIDRTIAGKALGTPEAMEKALQA